jgi:uncharacterized repeat protein (TIGR01451 family)
VEAPVRKNLFTGRRPRAPGPGAKRSSSATRYVPSLQCLEDRVTPTLGTFELDGNATALALGHDWDQVYNDAVLNPGRNTSGSISGAVTFRHDPVNSGTDDIFTGGQSKDINDLNQWMAGQGAPQAKADIADVYAVAYEVQVGGVIHTVLNFGTDKIDNNGNSTVGFWFFQNPIGINANGTFTGAHAPGDILLVADFSSSSATISAYRWVGPGGSTNALQQIPTDPSSIFATANTSNTPSGGWPFNDNNGTPANTFAPGEFVEGGIDLTALGLANNLNSFLVETRSSTSLNSTLSDLVLGTFDTFRPDLVVAKTDGVTSAAPGDTLTYAVTITNVGNALATGVTATDTIPDNTNFVGASDNGTFANGAVTWDIGPVGAGATVTRTVTVRVNTTVPAGVNSITNEVVVLDNGANGPDPTPVNNVAFDTDALGAAPDLTITKDDGVTQIAPGQTLTYTLTISNVGNQGATGVTVTDPIPANTTFVSAPRGTFANGAVTFDVGDLAAGATETRVVTVQVTGSVPAGVTAITNTAAVDDDHANGPDPTPANNTASDTDTTLVAAPDLTITKDDGVFTAQPGDTLTYCTFRDFIHRHETASAPRPITRRCPR